MRLKADKQPRMCFGLEHVRTGEILACTLVESKDEAERQLLGQCVHLPHLGKHKVVPLMLTVKKG
ncbi:MAG: hypothetical protein KGL42_14045 [Betaproteobacteria bacterium]|nr:hypothetical protein [Betaproteobacteria bacterium]